MASWQKAPPGQRPPAFTLNSPRTPVIGDGNRLPVHDVPSFRAAPAPTLVMPPPLPTPSPVTTPYGTPYVSAAAAHMEAMQAIDGQSAALGGLALSQGVQAHAMTHVNHTVENIGAMTHPCELTQTLNHLAERSTSPLCTMLSDQVGVLTGRSELLNVKTAQIDEQIARDQELLQAHQEQNQDRDAQLSGHSSLILSQKAAVSGLQQQATNLSTHLDANRYFVKDLQTKAETHESQLAAHQSRVADLSSQGQSHGMHLTEHGSQLKELSKQTAVQDTVLDAHKVLVQRLSEVAEDHGGRLTASKSQIDSLIDHGIKSDQQLTTHSLQLGNVSDKLVNNIAELSATKEQVEVLHGQTSTAVTQVEVAKVMLQSLQDASATHGVYFAEHNKKIEDLRQFLSNHEAKLGVVDSDIMRIGEQFSASLTSIESLTTQVQVLDQGLHNHKLNVDAWSGQVKGLQDGMGGHSALIAVHDDKIKGLRVHTADLQAVVKEETTTLHRNIADHKEALAQLAKQDAQHTETLEQHYQAQLRTQEKVQEHEDTYHKCQTDNQEMRLELERQDRAFAEKTAQLRTSIELQMQKIKGQYEVIDSLRQQISSWHDNMNLFKGQVEERFSQIKANIKSMHEDFNEKLSDMKAIHKEKFDDLSSRLNDTRDQLAAAIHETEIKQSADLLAFKDKIQKILKQEITKQVSHEKEILEQNFTSQVNSIDESYSARIKDMKMNFDTQLADIRQAQAADVKNLQDQLNVQHRRLEIKENQVEKLTILVDNIQKQASQLQGQSSAQYGELAANFKNHDKRFEDCELQQRSTLGLVSETKNGLAIAQTEIATQKATVDAARNETGNALHMVNLCRGDTDNFIGSMSSRLATLETHAIAPALPVPTVMMPAEVPAVTALAASAEEKIRNVKALCRDEVQISSPVGTPPPGSGRPMWDVPVPGSPPPSFLSGMPGVTFSQ
eukprot:gene2556-75_t